MEDRGRREIGPRSRIPEARRQAVLDAAAVLQIRRSHIAAKLERGEPCEAAVVARSMRGANEWLREVTPSWRELLAVRPGGVVRQLRISLPQDRGLVARGLRMHSVFDWDGHPPDARLLVASEQPGTYRFGVGPIQMKIVDRRFVLLQGPFLDEEMTLMTVTSPDCLGAAWGYWHAVLASSFPAEEEAAEAVAHLTRRQRQIVALLADDTRDEAIAESLEVSVRTVRSDIAELMNALGVRSRFAAGVRARELLLEG